MSIFSGRLVLAIMLAALGLGGHTAHAQTSPLTYWTPGWPMGLGGVTAGEAATTYTNFPGFEFRDTGGGYGVARYNFSNGWFVGSERGALGLSLNNQVGTFGNSFAYDGVQFGYNLQKSGLPLTVYAGFDTLKYSPGIGSLAPFGSMSSTAGYSAHAGVEIQPTSNVSVSLGFGVTQQSGAGRVDSDINSSVLPGATPFAFSSGRR